MQETVGSRIKALALQQALRENREPPKAQALASALGVSYESLRKWSAGKTAPNRARAEKIAAYLGCPIESFMLGVRFDEDDDAPEQPQTDPDEAELLAAFRSIPPGTPGRARVAAFAQGVAAASELGELQRVIGDHGSPSAAAA